MPDLDLARRRARPGLRDRSSYLRGDDRAFLPRSLEPVRTHAPSCARKASAALRLLGRPGSTRQRSGALALPAWDNGAAGDQVRRNRAGLVRSGTETTVSAEGRHMGRLIEQPEPFPLVA